MAAAQPSMVWITGAGGLIGNELATQASAPNLNWRVQPLTRAQLELTDFDAVTAAFQRAQPELILHCAALSVTGFCQDHPELAWRVNFEATRHLAELAGTTGARLLFFSTDLVFDGKQGAYPETAAVNPLSVYGETKVAAEQAVLAHPAHTVVRISLTGGTSPAGNRAFNEVLRRAWAESKETPLFTDEFRSPLPASVVAQATLELARQGLPGLFHVGGSERLSRWEMGRLVADRCPQLRPALRPVSLRDYVGPPRPPDTSLDTRHAQSHLSFPLPGLRSWLLAHPHLEF